MDLISILFEESPHIIFSASQRPSTSHLFLPNISDTMPATKVPTANPEQIFWQILRRFLSSKFAANVKARKAGPEKKIILAMTGTLLLPQTRSNLEILSCFKATLLKYCQSQLLYCLKCSAIFTGRWQFLPKCRGRIESHCRCQDKHSGNRIMCLFR